MNKLLLPTLWNIILIFILADVACSCNNDYDANLDLSATLMEEYPDSSLTILEDIDEKALRGSRNKARYALLKSIALDKNYIDTTTFDVLQPAIDYYMKNGSPDEKLKTLYYQGRIYKNAGDYDGAMQSYMKALDLENEITDSLTFARLLVAQGVLYFVQYRVRDLIDNNIKAANIYNALGKHDMQLDSYLRALDGDVILSDRAQADSLHGICEIFVKDYPELKDKTKKVFLKYYVEFGSEKDIEEALETILESAPRNNEKMTVARAYSKIGHPDRGLMLLNEVNVSPDNILDSLSFWVIKMQVLEKLCDYRGSLECFRNYSRILEIHNERLFSNELLFSEKKRDIEMENLLKLNKKDNVIRLTLAVMVILILAAGLVFYRYKLNRAKREIAERDVEKFKLETENLKLESHNFQLEIDRLEDERERLETLIENKDDLSPEMKEVIGERLDMLNGLFAKEITQEESYAKQFMEYVDVLKKDKKRFMNLTRASFQASRPKFISYLINHGLTEDECNYVCLYAIGLRGKEIGNYTGSRRHYNISSTIRHKLGLQTNETNLGPYIRRLIKEL